MLCKTTMNNRKSHIDHHLLCLLVIILLTLSLPAGEGWVRNSIIRRQIVRINLKKDDVNDDDEELYKEDWRDFRAKLVLQSELGPSGGWAYESGYVIEKGSIILSRPEQDFSQGLNQQYFHKCVILVLGHDTFTHGIILNRPTDLILSDKDFTKNDGSPLENSNSSNVWPVYFGGDVKGIDSEEDANFFCLHSLQSEAAAKVSENIMKDIQLTTFESARSLVQSNHATPLDFWVFAGYAGWGEGQLQNEIEREDWFMVATDSQTLLKELAELRTKTNPREAGIGVWNELMKMIKKEDIVEESFDDFMLREWARERLCFDYLQSSSPVRIPESNEFIKVGTLLRASSRNPSPFLLSDQEFHKSILLIISENEDYYIGLLLNLSTIKDYHFENHSIPIRFGGKYSMQGDDEFIWLHLNQNLQQAKVGSPLESQNGIWKCTEGQVKNAIQKNNAQLEDFMLVNHLSVWKKLGPNSLQAGVFEGIFEVVPSSQVSNVWNLLLNQKTLSTLSMEQNIQTLLSAWKAGQFDNLKKIEDDFVYKTSIRVSDLADDALRCWIATFLLGDSTLRRDYSGLE